MSAAPGADRHRTADDGPEAAGPYPQGFDSCYLLERPEDVAALRERVPDAGAIVALDDALGRVDAERDELLGLRDVVAILPRVPTPHALALARDALKEARAAGALSAKAVRLPKWESGASLRFPPELDTPGAVVAWLVNHPPADAPSGDAPGNGKPSGGPAAPADDLDDAAPLPCPSWPAPPDPAAYHGPLGAIVRAIEPHTEADPLAILAHLVVMFGNALGRGPHVLIEATEHRANEFAVVVGQSSLARKGTAADRARRAIEAVDAEWAAARIMGGLSSGEGLISAVRDPVMGERTAKDGTVEIVCIDAGVSDKRLLILESEFGGVLRALEREGNRLSALLRMAWDRGTLRTMTKSPMVASGAHVSIVGHITADELSALLGRNDTVNGFANRFLWFAVRRARLLPFGGGEPDLTRPLAMLADAARAASGAGPVGLSSEARRLWPRHYEALTAAPPGMLGEVTSRAAPHVLRLALIFALADGRPVIDPPHLAAALALWDASARSAAFIFGDRSGNPDADRILAALRAAAPLGLTRSEIRSGVFNRNMAAARIDAALSLLIRAGWVREATDPPTGGRPARRYYANAIDARNAQSPPPGRAGAPEAPPSGVNGVNGVPTGGGANGATAREVFTI